MKQEGLTVSKGSEESSEISLEYWDERSPTHAALMLPSGKQLAFIDMQVK